jgi:hypothetical protein
MQRASVRVLSSFSASEYPTLKLDGTAAVRNAIHGADTIVVPTIYII